MTRKREEFEKISAGILAHLNLSNDEPNGKLAKNFNDAKKARDKMEEKAKPQNRKMNHSRREVLAGNTN